MHVAYSRNLIRYKETCAKKFCEKIVFAGDSNLRRVAKSLHSPYGTRWCSMYHSRVRKYCTCADNDQWPYIANQGLKGFFFEVVRGLTELDAALAFVTALSTDTRVLILGNLVNWDVAFSTFETYEKRLKVFLSALKDKLASFTIAPMLVLRMGMYYCCNKHEDVFRLFTRKRVLMYNEYTLFAFRELFPGVIVWNPHALGTDHLIIKRVVFSLE